MQGGPPWPPSSAQSGRTTPSPEWGEGLGTLWSPPPPASVFSSGSGTDDAHLPRCGFGRKRLLPSALPPRNVPIPPAAGPLSAVLQPRTPSQAREPPQPHLAPRCGPGPRARAREQLCLPPGDSPRRSGGAQACPAGPLSPGPGRRRRWRCAWAVGRGGGGPLSPEPGQGRTPRGRGHGAGREVTGQGGGGGGGGPFQKITGSEKGLQRFSTGLI